MNRQKKRTQFTVEELRQNNWWVTGAKIRGGMEVLGANPEGELIYRYPAKLALPQVVWVSQWGIAVDRWAFIGFGIVAKPGLDRLMGWLRAWAAERNDLKPVVIELIDEMTYRAKHLENEASTRNSRVFLFEPKPNLSFASAGEQEE